MHPILSNFPILSQLRVYRSTDIFKQLLLYSAVIGILSSTSLFRFLHTLVFSSLGVLNKYVCFKDTINCLYNIVRCWQWQQTKALKQVLFACYILRNSPNCYKAFILCYKRSISICTITAKYNT